MPKFKVKGTVYLDGKKYEGTIQKPAEVDLPSNSFFITSPRYLDGVYIPASAEEPATITLPEGSFIDDGLKVAPPEQPKPHYAPGKVSNAPTAAEHFTPVEAKEASKKRANDKPVI